MPLPPEIVRQIRLDRAALLYIDMQRRHLDLEVGYHTLPPDQAVRVVERGGRAIEAARRAGMRIVHVGTWSRPPSTWGPTEGRNPFWAWQTGKPIPGASFVRQSGKCVEGSVWAEFMPSVAPLPGEPLVVKKKYSGFYFTDLELTLRSLGVEFVFVGGVNTNNCVLHTSFDAQARDFGVVVLEDACGSMNGQAYHEAALRQIEAAIGWTTTVDDFVHLLQEKTPASATPASLTA